MTQQVPSVERRCRRALCRLPIPAGKRRDAVYHEPKCRFLDRYERQQQNATRALPPAQDAAQRALEPATPNDRLLRQLERLRAGRGPMRIDPALNALALARAIRNSRLVPTHPDRTTLQGPVPLDQLEALEGGEALYAEAPLRVGVGLFEPPARGPAGEPPIPQVVIIIEPDADPEEA